MINPEQYKSVSVTNDSFFFVEQISKQPVFANTVSSALDGYDPTQAVAFVDAETDQYDGMRAEKYTKAEVPAPQRTWWGSESKSAMVALGIGIGAALFIFA